nr:hypothetical protein [Tanacetum cinerariifolium]
MTSFGYRLNPRYAIKECLSCGALYTQNCSCSKGNIKDKILVPKPLENCARCAKCGHPVNGPYCQRCALLRERLKEDLVSYLKYFHDTFESSDDSTNVVNAPREPIVVKQDHGVKSSQNPPPIDKCCCECGNALDGLFCQQCICKFCGKGAHIGYNCPPKVPIISNPEPYNQTINNELPQTLPSFDSVPCVSKPNCVDESSKNFNPPPQHHMYPCEFCGSNAQYGHYCTPKAQFNNPEQGYSQDFNFPQNIHNFQQHIEIQKKEKLLQLEQWAYLSTHPSKRLTSFCYDNDDDYDFAITPILSTEEPINSLSMGDEHLDIIPATKSDEVIKSSVEDLILIPTKDHLEIVMNSNNDISSSDDDSLHEENIEYVKASPHDSELVSLAAAEIVIPEVEEIEDDNL